jgi:hypothetical protein
MKQNGWSCPHSLRQDRSADRADIGDDVVFLILGSMSAPCEFVRSKPLLQLDIYAYRRLWICCGKSLDKAAEGGARIHAFLGSDDFISGRPRGIGLSFDGSGSVTPPKISLRTAASLAGGGRSRRV